ncbi:hypothetical protein KAJ77_00635 [bacterium]|nr:hypothetical protein [bacterium]
MLKRTTLKFFFAAAIISILTSGTYPVPFTGPAKLQAIHLPDNGVIIYQFHRRFRCDACYKLEVAINEGLKTHFPEELKTGRLVYRVMDLDEEGSDLYEKKYDFFYNTVIVVDIESGKETRFKNLEEVWGLVEDKQAMIDFIRSHVAEYL